MRVTELPDCIREQVDLQAFNTLAMPARARYFAAVESVEQLRAAVRWGGQHGLPLLVLGGGSNVILAGDWAGLVLQINIAGKRIVRRDGFAEVTIGAGENWHALVQWTLSQQLFGLENLTLIPGTAGAAPIQNIGAYGVEIAEHLLCVRGVDIDTLTLRELTAAECSLGYRDSVFKHALRDRFIITEIVLRLSEQFVPVVSYPALRDALASIPQPTAFDVERAVRGIRQSRLPDPAVLPNAGSFFKNPVVTAEHFERLQRQFPSMPSFAAPAGVKIPAAWLVEQSGWKARRVGCVGVHGQQALVLIHYRDERDVDVNAARALLDLAAAIQRDVHARFTIDLELEPTVYRSPDHGSAA
ncbi:MAG: UDP-N-acetylmuramate dehydrogenase [Thauera sp.]|jgi:UDP-N-acetylmuramate dehydrogenase|nr:UDP-N-acetylmuramate dehydrogenase [Thauera sp.]